MHDERGGLPRRQALQGGDEGQLDRLGGPVAGCGPGRGVGDAQTRPVPSAPGAECVTVTDGKITYSRFVFDRAPFDAARKAAT